LLSSLIPLLEHTRPSKPDCLLSAKNLRVITGCLIGMMCNASGAPTPGLFVQLADALQEVLPWGMHKPWAL
jgi:hypothetical protein